MNPFCDTFQSPFSTHGHRLSTGDEKNNVRWHQQKSHLTTRTLFELSGNAAAGSITNRCTIDQPLSAMLYLLYGAMIIPKRHCITIYLLQSGHWRCSSCQCTRRLWLAKILKMQVAHPPPLKLSCHACFCFCAQSLPRKQYRTLLARLQCAQFPGLYVNSGEHWKCPAHTAWFRSCIFCIKCISLHLKKFWVYQKGSSFSPDWGQSRIQPSRGGVNWTSIILSPPLYFRHCSIQKMHWHLKNKKEKRETSFNKIIMTAKLFQALI